jgi:hypothetical protein
VGLGGDGDWCGLDRLDSDWLDKLVAGNNVGMDWNCDSARVESDTGSLVTDILVLSSNIGTLVLGTITFSLGDDGVK